MITKSNTDPELLRSVLDWFSLKTDSITIQPEILYGRFGVPIFNATEYIDRVNEKYGISLSVTGFIEISKLVDENVSSKTKDLSSLKKKTVYYLNHDVLPEMMLWISDNLKRRHRKNKFKTYLLTDSSGLYKIGKSKNLTLRYHTLRLSNPTLKIVGVYDKDIEHSLHKKYKNKLVRHEWFDLDENDIKHLMTMFRPVRNEIVNTLLID